VEAESTPADCSTTSSANIPAVFFFLGNILIGIGSAPLFTVGIAHLDDVVSPKKIGIHLGFFYSTFFVVAPILGFFLGGYFLSIYVDPMVTTSLQIFDPNWVGAWWISFILSGVLSWLLAILFLMFPKQLPESKLIREERLEEMAQKYEGEDGGIKDLDLATKVKSFPRHLKEICTNPSWIFITLALTSYSFIITALIVFYPKYFEVQFGLTATSAGVISGAVGK